MKHVTVAGGFNLFLEHVLAYEGAQEKGDVTRPPQVQLGGGAFNVLKTLAALGVSNRNLHLCAFTAKTLSAQQTALDFLLDAESIPHTSLPVLSRPLSSYYLVPRRGTTWGLGDRLMRMHSLTSTNRRRIAALSKEARIRVVAEPALHEAEIEAAATLLKHHRAGQISVLIPSRSLLTSRLFSRLLPLVTLLACNAEEAKLLFGGAYDDAALRAHPVPYIFITNGPHTTILKTPDGVYRIKPKRLSRAVYVGGAGDAATAALIYELFIQNRAPTDALRRALSVGRATLLQPTSYFTNS